MNQFNRIKGLLFRYIHLCCLGMLVVFNACEPAQLPDNHEDSSPYYFKGNMDGQSFNWSLDADSNYVFADYELQYNRILNFKSKLAGSHCQGDCPGSFQISLLSQETYQPNNLVIQELLPIKEYSLVTSYELDSGLFCKIIPQAELPSTYEWNVNSTKPQLIDQDFYWNLYNNNNYQVCLHSNFESYPNTLTYTANFDSKGNYLDLKLDIANQTWNQIKLKASTTLGGNLTYRWSNETTQSTCTYAITGYPTPFWVEICNNEGISSKAYFALVPDGNKMRLLYQPFAATIYTQFAQSAKGKSLLSYIDENGKKWSTLPKHQNSQDGLTISKTEAGPLNAENKPTTIVTFTFSGIIQDEEGNQKYIKNAEGRIAVANPN